MAPTDELQIIDVGGQSAPHPYITACYRTISLVHGDRIDFGGPRVRDKDGVTERNGAKCK